MGKAIVLHLSPDLCKRRSKSPPPIFCREATLEALEKIGHVSDGARLFCGKKVGVDNLSHMEAYSMTIRKDDVGRSFRGLPNCSPNVSGCTGSEFNPSKNS